MRTLVAEEVYYDKNGRHEIKRGDVAAEPPQWRTLEAYITETEGTEARSDEY